MRTVFNVALVVGCLALAGLTAFAPGLVILTTPAALAFGAGLGWLTDRGKVPTV